MKVLLINPWEAEVFPTPAIGYLQAVIKELCPGITVDAVDLSTAINTKFGLQEYDITAVTFHSFSVKYARFIREKVRGRLICGGHHPSALPEQMLEIGYDQVVIGEGEQAIISILNGNLSDIINGAACDINTLPFPDYTGLKYDGSMGLPVISSRGCPFDCNFCASSLFWKRKWKDRSPENVASEIINNSIKGIKTFMFEDDNFTLNKKRAIEISNLIKGQKLLWQCASRADVLCDDELCRVLYGAGCRTVWLGIESLSQSSLDRAGKNIKISNVLKGIETAEKAGLQTMSQFIVGLPGDTEADIQETVSNIKASRISRRGANIAWILPGTEIYKQAKKHGLNDEIYLSHGAPYYTYEHDMNTLQRWSNLINTAR